LKVLLQGLCPLLLLLEKNEKSLQKDDLETFISIFETKTSQIAKTFFPLVTCTSLERAKMVRLATKGCFLPYKREISTH
jgi:succinate dehydrogenase flavin-adding protein (antitoxin of CptAB toxin-antitoxin module)